MKKILAIVLAFTLVAAMTGCGTKTENSTSVEETKDTETKALTETVEEETTVAETTEAETEEAIVDEGWDELEALGNIQTENGILTATITFPKDLVGEEITQEEIDAKAGEKTMAIVQNLIRENQLS